MDAYENDILDAMYPGLSAISMKQCQVYGAMISAVACEVALIEVENSADVQAVKDILQARIDYQADRGAGYPATREIWQKNSSITVQGNYLMMLSYDDAQPILDAFQALFA